MVLLCNLLRCPGLALPTLQRPPLWILSKHKHNQKQITARNKPQALVRE